MSSSNNLAKNPELDVLVKDIKFQIRKIFGGTKEQIERIGNFLKEKKLVKERDICIEIKSHLKEEIEEGLISERTIDRCCPEKWKRKTRPKAEERQMSFFEGQKEPKHETVTNTNTNVTSAGQVLQQEFDPDESKKVEEHVKQQHENFIGNIKRDQQEQIIKEQEEELKRLRPLAEVAKEQESEEIQQLTTENEQQKEEIQSLREKFDKLKEEGGEEVWTAIGILELGGNQVPLRITVNGKQKKIEHVEIDRENIHEYYSRRGP